ncbi:ATP-binding protein [Parasutterella sp.]|uniref:ATP-binding protein n=1 Tax=Parasutterella sp. TaxID=2049037 RepID=UPI003AF07F79
MGALIFIVTLFGSVLIIAYHPPFVQRFLKFFSSIQLLVIDEVGVQKGSESEKRILFSILDNRVTSKKPTILMTNLGIKDCGLVLGDRLYDRIRSKCVPVLFKGNSFRKPATPDVFD